MTLTLLQLGIFLLYTGFVWVKYGVQKSISESWYTLDKLGWMFTIVFCWGIGVTTIFHQTIWFVLSGSFLCFVGAATQFKSEKMTRAVHNVGATGCITLGLMGLGFDWGIWWPFIPVVLSVGLLTKKKNGTWWIETVAVFAIIGGLIQRYL